MRSLSQVLRGIVWAMLVLATIPRVMAQTNPLVIGAPIPAVKSYEYLDGSPIDFEQFKGKPFVIYLGADWCPPCFLARPTALEMAKKYRDKSVKVLLLMSDPEKRREANAKIAQEHGVLVGMSKKELCTKGDCRYGIAGGPWQMPKGSLTFPSAFVVDKDGILRATLLKAEPICDELEPELKKLLTDTRR